MKSNGDNDWRGINEVNVKVEAGNQKSYGVASDSQSNKTSQYQFSTPGSSTMSTPN